MRIIIPWPQTDCIEYQFSALKIKLSLVWFLLFHTTTLCLISKLEVKIRTLYNTGLQFNYLLSTMHKKHISLFFTPLSLSWFDVRILRVLFPRHGDFVVNVKIGISWQGIASATSPSHSISGNIGKKACNTVSVAFHQQRHDIFFRSVLFIFISWPSGSSPELAALPPSSSLFLPLPLAPLQDLNRWEKCKEWRLMVSEVHFQRHSTLLN